MSDNKVISIETGEEIVLPPEQPETILDDNINLNAGLTKEELPEVSLTELNEEVIESAIDMDRAKLILEAAILSASEPLQLPDLRKLFSQELSADMIRRLLEELKADWSTRAVELTPVASGWRFRVRPEFMQYVQRMNPEKPPRYSRAVMETLAIIAYRQPATRGDIAQIRGVDVSSQIIKTLEERAWIEAVGHREVPGRPALYATTKKFLDDLNLRSLEELPPLDELQMTLNITTIDNEASLHASDVVESKSLEEEMVTEESADTTAPQANPLEATNVVDQIEDTLPDAQEETHPVPPVSE